MKEKKYTVLSIQYMVVCLVSLLTLMLPYVTLKISIKGLDTLSQTKSMTGWELMKTLVHMDDVIHSVLGTSFSGIQGKSTSIILMIVAFYLVPLVLMIVNLVVHGVAMKQQKSSRKYAAIPVAVLVLGIIGQIAIRMNVQTYGDNILADATEDIMSEIGSVLAQTIEIRIAFSIGYYFLMILAIILLLEDLLLFPKCEIRGDEPFVPDGIYRQEEEQQKPKGEEEVRSVSTWSKTNVLDDPVYCAGEKPRKKEGPSDQEDPTVRSHVLSGMLIGLRGEYAGAEIRIHSGETIFIGRSKEICNLVLSNSRVSRKHCSIAYCSEEDKYLITNYSLNGTFLSNGQLLQPEQVYYLPHGTIFRINEEEEFRVL